MTRIDKLAPETLKEIFVTNCQNKSHLIKPEEDFANITKALKVDRVFFKLTHINANNFYLKIYSPNKKLTLSEILPSIESLGFDGIDIHSLNINNDTLEHPNIDFDINKKQLNIENYKESWIYIFEIRSDYVSQDTDFENFAHRVERALGKIYQGSLKQDALCVLILLCGFNWRQVKLFIAFVKYLQQIGFQYSQEYIKSVIISHQKYSRLLASLFDQKFNPDSHKNDIKITEEIQNKILKYIESVENSAEDKVLTKLLNLVSAIIRTNYHQPNPAFAPLVKPKDYISFKVNSSLIKDMPQPMPYAEIFVCSNDFEGVHLRGGKVARGGLRWSDRGEDYRTEVLGLMKAQMTKNSVIVPVGAKGGFFIINNQQPKGGCVNNSHYIQNAIHSYQNFLRGMLDITDNIIDGKIVRPKDTIVYDEDDPYLVVAADKGTASFSDHANKISKEYNFWLQDAFASGGSSGYDHKKMAITAKGAWISVLSHFANIDINPEVDVITVVGIGDMSGDVFGNGMLMSNTIKLVAAFNHMHIFIDPNPDTAISFKERLRLFNTPGSKWSDYDRKLISKGGGVFERNAKYITLSAEAKKLFDIKSENISPESLVKAILCANVDLIWNGGIGTYIKASSENNTDIGDKTNDNVRCNGNEIKAKVIAEGGNLGMSQLGRIEYARSSGRVNTDFIDNSAGVGCSDREVNIKIALNNALTKGKLSLEERDAMLFDMREQVEKIVLQDNIDQNEALTVCQNSELLNTDIFAQLINSLEEDKLLDRNIEFLPSNEELNQRAKAKEKFTRPELAVLLSYSKRALCNELTGAKLTQEKYFEKYLIDYFPKNMREKFKDEILNHPLRHEIIVNIITNKIVNNLSGATVNTIKKETGGLMCDIARSYFITCEIFDLDNLWHDIRNLNTQTTSANKAKINSLVITQMLSKVTKIIRRGISWFIRNSSHPIDIEKTIMSLIAESRSLAEEIPALLAGEAKEKFDYTLNKYIEADVPETIAKKVASLDNLVSVFDIITITKDINGIFAHKLSNNSSLFELSDANIAKLYFKVGDRFFIDWLRKNCEAQSDDSYWNRLSIQSIKDDLYDKQKRLLIKIIQDVYNENELGSYEKIKMKSNIVDESIGSKIIDNWTLGHSFSVNIFFDFVKKIEQTESLNLNMIILANKKLEMFLRKLN